MRAKRRNTLERIKNMRISKCSSLAGWCFETRLTIQLDSTHPTPLPHCTSRGPNHEMAAWKGANELEFLSVIQLTKKNIIIKQKVIWVKAPGLGVYLFNIDVSRYFWIYIGLCIYQIYIYIYVYPTWTPWALWEWFEFLFKPLRCGSRLGIISLEHRNVLGFEQKISGKLGGKLAPVIRKGRTKCLSRLVCHWKILEMHRFLSKSSRNSGKE